MPGAAISPWEHAPFTLQLFRRKRPEHFTCFLFIDVIICLNCCVLIREFEQFCSLLLRCREPKEMSALDKCFEGYAYSWNWLRHYNDDATVSHNNENCNCLRASSPFKGYRGNLLGSGTRNEKREKQGAGKRSESSLARSLATRNGEVPTRHNISWWSCSFAIRWAGIH